MPNLPTYLPMLILLAAALGVVGLDWQPRLRPYTGWLATLGVAVALVVVLYPAVGFSGVWLRLPAGDISLKLGADGLSQPFVLLNLLLGGLALLGSSGTRQRRGFYPTALLLLTALLGVYLATGFFWLAASWCVVAVVAWMLILGEGQGGETQARAIGATLAGLCLLGAVAYLARLNGGRLDYAAITPSTITDLIPLLLLLLGLLIGAAQYPLIWVGGGTVAPHWAGRALGFGLGLGLPELYIALRVERIVGGGGLTLPEWWYLTLAIVGGVTALLGGIFALLAHSAGDALAMLTVSGGGLALFALSLHSPAADTAALLLGFGLAAGRVAIAVGSGGGQRLTAIAGGFTLAMLPPFGGFIGWWLLLRAALSSDHRVALFVVAASLLLTLPTAAALVAESRGTVQDSPKVEAETAPPRRFKLPLASTLALIGLAAFSLALTLAAPFRAWLLGGWDLTAADSLPTLGIGAGLGTMLLLWLGLNVRGGRVATAIEPRGMGAADVLAPFGLYLRWLRWLHPRTWAALVAPLGGVSESALARLDHALEGRYYIIATALFLLVALLVMSR